MAKPGDAQHDESGVELAQSFRTEPEPRHGSGGEVLDEHIGAGRKCIEHLAPGVCLEVDND